MPICFQHICNRLVWSVATRSNERLGERVRSLEIVINVQYAVGPETVEILVGARMADERVRL